jgi:hypothetical protein
MKYRPHRELLADSMAEIIEVGDRAGLIAYLARDLAPWGYRVSDEDVRIEPYCYDKRIDWDTHIVLLRNKEVAPDHWFFGSAKPDYFGAIGFTDSEQ